MPERQLLPFALPTGRTGNVGRLTVYLSPRLKETGRLSDYPEWIDWPATLAGLTTRVLVDGAPVRPRVVGPRPSSAVWTAVFAPNARVDAHRFVDFSSTPLQPMAAGDFSTGVLDLYVRTAAEHPDGPPSGPALLALAAAAGLLDGAAPQPQPGTLDEADAYRAPMDDPDESDPEPPDFDVHATISLLGHHPELLRHLGLALDLEVPLPAAPAQVQVTLGYGGAGGQAVEVDLITLTTAGFLARPNPDPAQHEQAGGFLDLTTEDAFLSIVDPQLAAVRLGQAVDRADEVSDGTLPALATRALTLVRPDLTTTYANRTKRQAQLERDLQTNLGGGPPVRLFAEDVTIGQRIDVLDPAAAQWLSLFERRSDDGYTFPRDATIDIVPKPDEGWNTTLLVTEQADTRPAPNPDRDDPIAPTALFRLDDAVYRWNGWSGAAPRPGQVLDSVTGAVAEIEPNLPADGDQTGQVAIDYRVEPGSLPRLRFGRTYQLRARCVDLAGNSLDPATPDGIPTEPEPFGRLEPITAPDVVRRLPRPQPGVGDTPVEIVLRSDIDTPEADIAPDERLFFPGRVGQDLCELHGLPEGGADPASYADLATRDVLDLTDQTETDARTGELLSPAGTPARQQIGYLCDPAADGLRFDFPSLGEPTVATLKGDWPKRQSVRLVVAPGAKGPVADPDPDTDLTVFVPQAGIVTGSVSYSIDPAFLDQFALWQRLGAADQATLAEQVMSGGHWMFTPSRPVTLIHAVRRPLLAPTVTELIGTREPGSAGLSLDGTLVTSCLSTERVRVSGTWTDTIDDPEDDAPAPRRTALTFGSVDVVRADSDELAVAGLSKRLPDTKRHEATIGLEAYSSFAAYFTEEKIVALADRPVLLDARGVVASSVEVRLPDGRRADVGADVRVQENKGLLARVPSGAVPSGARVRVRYVARPISRSSDEAAAPFTMIIPNTVAPPVPVVSEVIPASARGADGTHSGQVLRIYLARPWLVSGDGEALAVDLAATRVGRDPILTGADVLPTVTAAHFPRANAVTDTDGRALAVHPVAFDPDSKRWYADVELADGFGYRPFLQLAVARYQPDSLAGAARSATVTLEAVRLGLVRNIAVTPDQSTVDVSVGGLDGFGNRLQASVQQADPTIADADLRWQPTGDPVELTPVVSRDETTWSGSLPLPKSSDSLRVVIEESEPGLGHENDASGNPTQVWTTVFVEAVELPDA